MKLEELKKAIEQLSESDKTTLFNQIMMSEINTTMGKHSSIPKEQFQAQFIAEVEQEAKQLRNSERFAI